MAKFKFGARSLRELEGVHNDLRKVMFRALELTNQDFAITDGVRTIEEQKEYVRTGASTTLKSRHVDKCAVDVVACIPNGKISYNPLLMMKIKAAVFAAARELGIPIRWGGDWNCNGDTGDETFVDMPHFELPRSKRYP